MIIEDIISKYLSQSATENEKENLLLWLEEKKENRMLFKQQYDLWLYSNALLTENSEMGTALARLKERTSSKTHTVAFHIYLIRIAVSILLLVASGYGGYIVREHTEQKAIIMNNLLTGTDGKGEYLLPDGSIVWLNANSVLRYPETFTGGKRIVQLEGEALFEVQKDKNNPFIVEAGGMEIEVVGTRFLVNNYPQKNIAEAVLINGEVKISGDYFAGNLLIKPSELMTYNKLTGATEFSTINTDDYTNWIHSKLVFDKTNLTQVIINLEKWFGVEIVASPDLMRTIHMSFTIRRESLEEVLTYMSKTTPISYRWDDNSIHLFSTK